MRHPCQPEEIWVLPCLFQSIFVSCSRRTAWVYSILPSMILPSFLTVTTRGSSFCRSEFAVVAGKSTSSPWVIIGAVTMKMISNTNITSTRGVTLISATNPLGHFPCLIPFPFSSYPVKKYDVFLCAAYHVAFNKVEKIGGEILHLSVNIGNLIGKIIIKDNCRYGNGKACSSCYQGLGDTRSDNGQ